MASVKGPGEVPKHDGSKLRIAIVHARWNSQIVDRLVQGACETLMAQGVMAKNIYVSSVPGSWELPMAVRGLEKANSNYTSNLPQYNPPGMSINAPAKNLPPAPEGSAPAAGRFFDAIIAVGVLIKGKTMHFEYISEATTQGLMRVQLDIQTPVILGVLTVLSEDQAWLRAGVAPGKEGDLVSRDTNDSEEIQAHNHGIDWAMAAVEMGTKKVAWARGLVV